MKHSASGSCWTVKWPFWRGQSAFILQRYYQKKWAENFMMQLMVDDLDAWWAHIESLDLARSFAVAPPNLPKCSRGDYE
jgi:hypothetical protein